MEGKLVRTQIGDRTVAVVIVTFAVEDSGSGGNIAEVLYHAMLDLVEVVSRHNHEPHVRRIIVTLVVVS
jgi:hypothetical protein